MAKKQILEPIQAGLAQIWAPRFFSWVLSLLDIRHVASYIRYSVSRAMYDPNLRKWPKTSFWASLRPVGPKFGPSNISHKSSSQVLFQAITLRNLKKNQDIKFEKTGKNLIWGAKMTRLSQIQALIYFFCELYLVNQRLLQSIVLCNFKENL